MSGFRSVPPLNQRKPKKTPDPDHPDVKFGQPDGESPRASMGPSVEEMEIAKEVNDLMAAYDDLETHVNAAISLMPLFEGRGRYFHGIQDQSMRLWKQYNNVLFSQADGTVPETTLARHFQRYNGRYKPWMENLVNDDEK
ncbi:hypothetical protein I204_03046 [Kwoniella mangroviensis CBS 8886]|nr:hypothetical protein I204_03046 [Kwoniella mangroviensis CBS 8886]